MTILVKGIGAFKNSYWEGGIGKWGVDFICVCSHSGLFIVKKTTLYPLNFV